MLQQIKGEWVGYKLWGCMKLYILKFVDLLINFEPNLLINEYIYDFIHEKNEINSCNENNTL